VTRWCTGQRWVAELCTGAVLTGNISAELSASTGSLGANSGLAGGTSDNDNLAFEAEEVLELGGLGNLDGHSDGLCWIGRVVEFGGITRCN